MLEQLAIFIEVNKGILMFIIMKHAVQHAHPEKLI